MAKPDEPKVLLYGHSFIRRLENFVQRADVSRNFDFNDNTEVSYVGYGGATVSRLRKDSDRIVQSYRPDILILQIGGNDTVIESDPQVIFNEIVSFARHLHYTLFIREVVVSSLFCA